jgi:hypothetical protein
MNTKTKISLFALFAITLSVATIGNAFAETREQKIERLLSEAEKVYLQMQETTDARAKTSLDKQLDALAAQLEEFGIPTTEKYEANRDYWAMKSSEHLNGRFIDSPIGNFILPLANAVGSPQFMLGYAHDCAIIFTCHEWTNTWTTIPAGSSNSQTKALVSSHTWMEAKWQIRATDSVVTHNYVYKLKDGSGNIKQSQTGSLQTVHVGTQTSVKTMPRYNNPAFGWNINAQWAVIST